MLLSWEQGVTISGEESVNNKPTNGLSCEYETEIHRGFPNERIERDRGEIRAAIILPSDSDKYEVALSRVMPVLVLAERAVHQRNLLPGYYFNFIPSNGRCDAVYAQHRAIEAYAKSNVHVFFGPVCEYSVGK